MISYLALPGPGVSSCHSPSVINVYRGRCTVTTREVAGRLGIAIVSVRKMLREGRLQGWIVRNGGARSRWDVREIDLQRFLLDHRSRDEAGRRRYARIIRR